MKNSQMYYGCRIEYINVNGDTRMVVWEDIDEARLHKWRRDTLISLSRRKYTVKLVTYYERVDEW